MAREKNDFETDEIRESSRNEHLDSATNKFAQNDKNLISRNGEFEGRSPSGVGEAENVREANDRSGGAAAPAENFDYDFILIDSPPSLSLLTVNALVAADTVILPVQAEFYALEGLGQLLETMKLVRKGLNPTLELLGVLVTMYDSRTTLAQEVYEEVAKHFPGKILETKIPRNVRLAEAPSHGLPVGAYDRFSKGSRSYRQAAEEIAKRVGWAK